MYYIVISFINIYIANTYCYGRRLSAAASMSALEAVAAWADVGLFSPWEEIDSCVDSISCIATGVYSCALVHSGNEEEERGSDLPAAAFASISASAVSSSILSLELFPSPSLKEATNDRTCAVSDSIGQPITARTVKNRSMTNFIIVSNALPNAKQAPTTPESPRLSTAKDFQSHDNRSWIW